MKSKKELGAWLIQPPKLPSRSPFFFSPQFFMVFFGLIWFGLLKRVIAG
jgi:hypothetical protein